VITILIVASLTLLASLSCSLFEAVLYSITPTQIELLKHGKVSGARRLSRLRDNIEEPITAILTLNTIAHTLGAAWCGAIVAREYGDNSVGTFVAIFTLFLLVFTEIIPKSVGVKFAKKLGPYCAWPIQIMTWLMLPIARPAQFFMRKLMGGGEQEGPSKTELILFSRLAATKGGVREEEHRWIENALRLDKRVARDLLTPRTVVEVLATSTLVSELRYSKLIHSRIPVIDGTNPDRVRGVVYRRELFDAIANEADDSKRVEDLMHPIHFVPETIPANTLLSKFVSERRHMLAVADEHGGFMGVVTLEDVIESLLGEEIVDEHDEHSDLQHHAREIATTNDAEE
jgi:CBS domain containing-hemolysin-like protein